MPLGAGTRLAHYEIVEPIGKGGMGEVYRARDMKLGREVAIKVLPDELANDEERAARFEREAKFLASLNHPNIAGIYGFEDADGVKALVLELVEGPTLADRIARGPIPVDEALPIARQIAEAIEAGHEAGIIHRDLKPANIKLKEDGTVKVLDNGLAKALESDAPVATEAELSQSPTLTRQGTQIGIILGTAAYMSPEQAKGKRVDKRTDIFAFGAVVYEMLAGRRAFPGEDVSEVLASVIKSEPDWTALPTQLDPHIERLLRRCLDKDRQQRRRDIGDVRIELEQRAETGTIAVTPPPTARKRWVVPAAIAVGILFGVGVSRRPEPPRSVVRFEVPLPSGKRFAYGGRDLLATLSPDDSRIAFLYDRQLHFRSLDTLDVEPIRGTQGPFGVFGRAPLFSPDGTSLVFWADGKVHEDLRQRWSTGRALRGGPPGRCQLG